MVLRKGSRLMLPVLFGALALLLAFSMMSGRSSAQLEPVSSPVASPQMGDCNAGSGSPSAPAMATPAGTPAADLAAQATPASSDVASGVQAAADNVINCLNAGDVDSLATLVDSHLLADKFGGSVPDNLLQYTVLGYGDTSTYADGRVGIELQYLAGDYQYVTATWIFVANGDSYVLDEESLMPSYPDGDSVVKGFSVADDQAVLFDQGGTAAQLPVITLLGTNNSSTGHYFELYYLGDLNTATPDESTPAAGVPSDAELAGTVSLAAGEIGDIALVNAPVGNYLVLDTSDGSVANFQVTEPEAQPSV